MSHLIVIEQKYYQLTKAAIRILLYVTTNNY